MGDLDEHNKQAARQRARERAARDETELGPVVTDPIELRGLVTMQVKVTGERIQVVSDEHIDHGRWREVRPCVYCSCGARLYQGRLPRSTP